MYIENDKRNIEQDEGKEEKNITKKPYEINFYHNSRYIYTKRIYFFIMKSIH